MDKVELPVSAKLLIGYRLRPVDPEAFMPAYRAPANYKQEDKIADFIAGKRASFVTKAGSMPYTATFDEVYISSPRHEEVNRWVWSSERGVDKGKLPICLAVSGWILKRYPDAWSNDVVNRGPVRAVVMGFNPRLFLKILGLECSLPQHSRPLPLGLWHDNTDHRDIAKAIVPHEFEDDLDLSKVLTSRGIKIKDGWTPCVDPEEDVRITAELACQLNMLYL